MGLGCVDGDGRSRVPLPREQIAFIATTDDIMCMMTASNVAHTETADRSLRALSGLCVTT
jgi:hypothetical protein